MIIKRGITSKEHDDCVMLICEKFNLHPVEMLGYKKGKYFPDAIDLNGDYEVEVVPRKNYLLKKSLRWNRSRRKILVLKINSFAIENFDEIYINDDGNLVKIK